MSTQTDIKAFEEKVSAELQAAKSQIETIEKNAKGKLQQAQIEAINAFKAWTQELDKKRQSLKTSAVAQAAQLKTEIEADIAKFKGSLAELHSKFNNHAATK